MPPAWLLFVLGWGALLRELWDALLRRRPARHLLFAAALLVALVPLSPPRQARGDWWPDVCANQAWSFSQLDACLGSFYGVSPAFMERLAACESGTNPWQNTLDTNGQWSYGRFQYQYPTFLSDLAASNATPDGSGIDSGAPWGQDQFLNTKLAFFHVAHYGAGAWATSIARMNTGGC